MNCFLVWFLPEESPEWSLSGELPSGQRSGVTVI